MDPVGETFAGGTVAVRTIRETEQIGAVAAGQAVVPGATVEDVVAAEEQFVDVGVTAADQLVVAVATFDENDAIVQIAEIRVTTTIGVYADHAEIPLLRELIIFQGA
ncbi:hypothetical protein GCM10027398_00950 [Azotobacter salinestris]